MDRFDGVPGMIAQKGTAMNDELDGRKVLNSAFDFTAPRRGPTEVYALNSAMPVLADAIAEAADLYEFDGRIVVLADGEPRIVTPAVLAEAIRANLVRKSLRNVGDAWERAFVPVEVGEMVLRLLLQDERHGLLGRLPIVRSGDAIPRGPQVETAEAAVVPLLEGVEFEAGRAALAKHAGAGGERTRGEIERGQQRLAQFRT
jgi:hypothetical protein